MQKGNRGEKDSFIVMKEHMSGIDFSENWEYENVSILDLFKGLFSKETDLNTMLTAYNTKHLEKVEPKEKRCEEKKYNYDGNCVFEIDGIKFSLEICLDHLKGRVDKQNELKEAIDMQLVTSSGADLKINDSLSRNGIAFLCDGIDSSSDVIEKKLIKKSVIEKEYINLCSSKHEGLISKSKEGKLCIYEPIALEKHLDKNVTSRKKYSLEDKTKIKNHILDKLTKSNEYKKEVTLNI